MLRQGRWVGKDRVGLQSKLQLSVMPGKPLGYEFGSRTGSGRNYVRERKSWWSRGRNSTT